MNKIIEKLKEKKGSGYIKTVVIVLATLLIGTVIMEYFRIKIIVTDVRDSLQSSIISVTTDNWNEKYEGLRQEKTYSYRLDENNDKWVEDIDMGDVENTLARMLRLSYSNEKYIHMLNQDEYGRGDIDYRIKDIKVIVKNTSMTKDKETYKIDGFLNLEIEEVFGIKTKKKLEIKIKTSSKYIKKF